MTSIKSPTRRPEPLIEGQVATVLKESNSSFSFVEQLLAINVGSERGVKTGMEFNVLEKEIQITDPDSGESLGTVTTRKGRVRVTTVSERFSIAAVVESAKALMPSIGGTFPAIDDLEIGDRVVEVRPKG